MFLLNFNKSNRKRCEVQWRAFVAFDTGFRSSLDLSCRTPARVASSWTQFGVLLRLGCVLLAGCLEILILRPSITSPLLLQVRHCKIPK